MVHIKLRGLGTPGSILLLGGISIGDHLNIIVGGPFKLCGKNYIEGARGPSINIITGGTFKFRAIKYYCRGFILIGDHLNIIVGAHLNSLAKIKLMGPGLLESILLLVANLIWLAEIKMKGPGLPGSILL